MNETMFLLGNDFFAKTIADKSGLCFAQVEQRVFPDGEVCPRLPALQNEKCILCARTEVPVNINSYVMEILFLANMLKKQGASCNTLIMPYLVYGRQDKSFRQGEPASLHAIMDMLHGFGIEKVITVTSHSQREKGKFFSGGVEIINLNGFLVLQDYLKNFPHPVIVAPDGGSEKWAADIAAFLETRHVVMQKERDKNTGEIITSLDEPQRLAGKNVMIIDDIISSGSTMHKALELCRSAGAKKVGCAAVHGLFTSGSESLREACKNIVATDTVHSEYANITVTGMIAKELSRS